jgi:hypothetical protein
MAVHGHSMVPHFDGNALNLHLYFDEVESLSIDASLNEQEQSDTPSTMPVRRTMSYGPRSLKLKPNSPIMPSL